MVLRKESIVLNQRTNKVSFSELQEAYWELSFGLDDFYKLEQQQTLSEHILYNKIVSQTKLKVLRSFWIGKRNYDFFIPALKSTVNYSYKYNGESTGGVVIEVDGKVHQEYLKMKRDQSKYEQLSRLGICCSVINNDEIGKSTVKNLIERLPAMPRLDSRGKKRLLRKIYIVTLLAHKEFVNDEDLQFAKAILIKLGDNT